MNRYIFRTSLVWVTLIAVATAVYFYRDRGSQSAVVERSEAQPIASGPVHDETNDTSVSTAKMEVPLVPVQLTNDQMNSIGVMSGNVGYKQLNDDIRATGTVDVDERLESTIQVRFSGYVRKVFVDATYQYVRKGQPLFTIYSPDLVATQQEYLLARKNQMALGGSSVDGVAVGASSLATAAEQRLRQWDIPEVEIAKLKQTGKVIQELSINSPSSGYVMERDVLPNMYVEPATKLYLLADLGHIWVDAQVFQDDVGKVKRGDVASITVDAYVGRTFPGRVGEILPQVDLATRTVKVRLEMNNPGIKLKPGMFVNVDLMSGLGRQLVVPASAVFQTGLRQVVFIDHGNGSLEPKDVSLGEHVGDDFVVLKGLEANQRIVTSANFLLDSESQLEAASGQLASTQSATSQPSRGASAIGVEFTTDPNPAHKGQNKFRAKVTGAAGAPVVGAVVTAAFLQPGMPAMGMGSKSTSTVLMQTGAGLYEGSGLLESSGTWQVLITVKEHGQTIATKQLRVNAAGGM